MKQDRVFKGVLFDMDGVIIDSASEVEGFWQPRFREHGIRLSDREFLIRIHGRPAREVIDEFFASEPGDQRDRLFEQCRDFDNNHPIRLVPGVEDVLEQLRELGVPTGMVTSAVPSKVRNVLQVLDTNDYFSVIVTSEDIREGKPNPECYRKGAAALGLQPEDCVVFEDSVNGIRAGQKAGALVIAVNKPVFGDLLKHKGALTVIPDFSRILLKRADSNLLSLSLNGRSVSLCMGDGAT
jgi:HAD superfamily hydrolase (TIGR01509 family)